MSNTIQSEDLSKYKSADACLDLKIQHDKCFHKWMREKFLNGTATQDDCLPVWSLYESCIKVSIWTPTKGSRYCVSKVERFFKYP